ncbi:uncharacterized protein ALTATR162_LOCUS11700 [Alternaria atra]|nr:uncharacterized protein ALTATR162_LOCUS11700 [Alternaria atra]CAG5187367.1 unnamed protein product [Alternaria atra]
MGLLPVTTATLLLQAAELFVASGLLTVWTWTTYNLAYGASAKRDQRRWEQVKTAISSFTAGRLLEGTLMILLVICLGVAGFYTTIVLAGLDITRDFSFQKEFTLTGQLGPYDFLSSDLNSSLWSLTSEGLAREDFRVSLAGLGAWNLGDLPATRVPLNGYVLVNDSAGTTWTADGHLVGDCNEVRGITYRQVGDWDIVTGTNCSEPPDPRARTSVTGGWFATKDMGNVYYSRDLFPDVTTPLAELKQDAMYEYRSVLVSEQPINEIMEHRMTLLYATEVGEGAVEQTSFREEAAQALLEARPGDLLVRRSANVTDGTVLEEALVLLLGREDTPTITGWNMTRSAAHYKSDTARNRFAELKWFSAGRVKGGDTTGMVTGTQPDIDADRRAMLRLLLEVQRTGVVIASKARLGYTESAIWIAFAIPLLLFLISAAWAASMPAFVTNSITENLFVCNNPEYDDCASNKKEKGWLSAERWASSDISASRDASHVMIRIGNKTLVPQVVESRFCDAGAETPLSRMSSAKAYCRSVIDRQEAVVRAGMTLN